MFDFGEDIEVMKIIKSKRKTISIEITSDAEVIVRAPKRISDKVLYDFLEEKKDFIDKNIEKMNNRKDKLSDIRRITDIELEELIIQAKSVIPERVRYYAPIVGVDYGRITVRNQRTRWGSCSSKGNLNFNVALMRVPLEVLDYVVVHELCHRIEMNHSRRFWDNVEKVIPEYKTYRKWLKDNGDIALAEING